MRLLRTNTATRVSVGPFIGTDGLTPKTALTVTNCKLTMTVDDGGVPTLVLDTNPTASGGNNDMVHITGDDAGMYDLELAAANVNYLGRAMLVLTDAANHCPVFAPFMIVPAMIYDALVLGTDRLDTNVTHIGDTAQTARDLGLSVLVGDKTGFSLSSAGAQAIRTEIDSNSTQLAAVLTAIGNLNNLSALANLYGPSVLEIPDSGTTQYPFTVVFRDGEGKLVDVDTNAVTLAIANGAGTDRSANASAVTHASLGVYTFTYGVASDAAKEGLRIAATAAYGAEARRADRGATVSDTDTATAVGQILALVTNLPADPASETNATANADAIAALIAALNNLSAAQAQDASASALAAYDPPTKTEMDAAIAAIPAAPTPAEVADGFLARNQVGGSDGPPEESVSAALAPGLMKFERDLEAGTLTVLNADGSTAFERDLVEDAAAGGVVSSA